MTTTTRGPSNTGLSLPTLASESTLLWTRARVAKWVDAGDLKSPGLGPCRFESCPGQGRPLDGSPAFGGLGPADYEGGRPSDGSCAFGGLGPGVLLVFQVDGVGEGADFVCFQEFVEGVAVEQGGSHVSELRQLQLQTIDFARCSEDLPDSEAAVVSAFENLRAKGLDNALGPDFATRERIEQSVGASTAIGDLVRPVLFHG